MAKRKRLELPTDTETPVLEMKSALPPRARMPIADVAGDTAGRAALEEVAREMTAAESEGRVVKRLKIDQIDMHHLNRDRLVLDAEDMAVLKASLAERGQQTPIEVVDGSRSGRFGLISGMRRLLALREMGETEVLALIRRPETAQAAYVAMVEENEIRAPLSFYERANLAVASVGSQIYPDVKTAVSDMFAHVSGSKRSKILKFVTLREKLGATLSFPTEIPEKLGLALVTAIEADIKVATRIRDALRKTPPADAAAERRVLERALKGQGAAPSAKTQIAPGLLLEAKAGRAVLTGQGVDESFLAALQAFAVSHAKAR